MWASSATVPVAGVLVRVLRRPVAGPSPVDDLVGRLLGFVRCRDVQNLVGGLGRVRGRIEVVDLDRRRDRSHLVRQIEDGDLGLGLLDRVDDRLEHLSVDRPATDDPIQPVVVDDRRYLRDRDRQEVEVTLGAVLEDTGNLQRVPGVADVDQRDGWQHASCYGGSSYNDSGIDAQPTVRIWHTSEHS